MTLLAEIMKITSFFVTKRDAFDQYSTLLIQAVCRTHVIYEPSRYGLASLKSLVVQWLYRSGSCWELGFSLSNEWGAIYLLNRRFRRRAPAQRGARHARGGKSNFLVSVPSYRLGASSLSSRNSRSCTAKAAVYSLRMGVPPPPPEIWA